MNTLDAIKCYYYSQIDLNEEEIEIINLDNEYTTIKINKLFFSYILKDPNNFINKIK
mgnify:FL=1